MTTPPTPHQQALDLLAQIATTKASLEAASAPTLAQIATLQAALTLATSEPKARLAALEEQAKQLALTHGPEIFGEDKSSLIECGLILAVRPSQAVQIEDEDSTILMLKRAAESTDLNSAMACKACLRVTTELDKQYILRAYDESPRWFAQFGITVVDKLSASLKPAPKPRQSKSKAKTKARTDSEPDAEAA